MQLPSLNRWHFIFAATAFFAYSMTGCSKNSNPNNNRNDSDTVLHRTVYDSAKFYITFDMEIAKTSGVFNDTFSDHASMIVYVVNGVVKVPPDSLRNFPPIVYPASGSSGAWSATWIPDNIGEIDLMIFYVVNGVVKVPPDSLRNFPPIVYPASGSSGAWSATWIPDNIGEINVTGATG